MHLRLNLLGIGLYNQSSVSFEKLYPFRLQVLHAGDTSAAYFQPSQNRSLPLSTHLQPGVISGKGTLNFFGDKHIQFQLPLSGCAPDVSIFVCKPACCNFFVEGLYIKNKLFNCQFLIEGMTTATKDIVADLPVMEHLYIAGRRIPGRSCVFHTTSGCDVGCVW